MRKTTEREDALWAELGAAGTALEAARKVLSNAKAAHSDARRRYKSADLAWRAYHQELQNQRVKDRA